MHISTIDEANLALSRFVPGPRSQAAAYTLDGMKHLMEILGNPQNTLQVVHIAGTSGKTSTAYYMAAFLKASGHKVGLTISPHIDSVNERVQINLEPLPEAEFCEQLGLFLDILEENALTPSYFELLIAFAYWLFARQGVDYAVVEVGLGGLLDGTNVVSRADKVCVITDIGLDHTEILGQTLGEIASQKAGIIHPDNVVFMYEQPDEVMAVVREVCQQQQAVLHEILSPPAQELTSHLPLFQQRNWYLAHTVFGYIAGRDKIGALNDTQLRVTAQTLIPARMEIMQQGETVLIMDGSHNQQKIHSLTASITKQFPQRGIATLFSLSATSKNQKVREAVREIITVSDYLIITSFTSQQDMIKQAVNPKKIAAICDELGFKDYEIVHDPRKAYLQLNQRAESIHLVTGSFYLLNHIRPLVAELSNTN